MKISELVQVAYKNAVAKGFYDNEGVTFGDRIALCHSELSEALEAFRMTGLEGVANNIPRTPNGKPEGVPSELADVVIRIADMCGAYSIDLEAAIVEKVAFNATRPYRHGGKKL